MQFLWKYIDDLVGKGLNWYVIFELLFYMSSTLVPLAIPIAILLSSIMTLGGLGEHYELTAMKSSGTGLPRIMYSLFLFSIVMTIGSFYFSNNILPVANLKGLSLLYDVREQKPALNIKEGIFYSGINDYSLWVGKKDGDGQTIHQVYIYDHTSGRGNDNVLYADKGSMKMSDDKKYLQIELFDGKQFQELTATTAAKERNFEQTRTSFKVWKKTFDLSELSFTRTKEDLFKENYQMKNLSQLNSSIDTFKIQMERDKKLFAESIRPLYFFMHSNFDSLNHQKKNSMNVSALATLQPQQVYSAYEIAVSRATTFKRTLDGVSQNYRVKQESIIGHEIEINRKFMYAFTCIMMLIIGAPLGAIIRKGGIGWPIIIAVLFFVLFYVLSITGEKMAKEQILSPIIGMWFPCFVLTPIGLFLMYKSSHDALLIDFSFFRKMKDWLRTFLFRKLKNS